MKHFFTEDNLILSNDRDLKLLFHFFFFKNFSRFLRKKKEGGGKHFKSFPDNRSSRSGCDRVVASTRVRQTFHTNSVCLECKLFLCLVCTNYFENITLLENIEALTTVNAMNLNVCTNI